MVKAGSKHSAWKIAAVPLIVAGSLGLAACQRAGSAALVARTTPGASQAATAPSPMPPPDACADDLTATLRNGVVVRFQGAAPDHPALCVQSWNGREHRYVLGFWGSGRARAATPGEQQAIRTALSGPIGTKASFRMHSGDRRLALWNRATITHVGNAEISIDGRPRPSIALRVERHDALHRPGADAESMIWIDCATGIPLRKEMVVQSEEGIERYTTWEIRSLESSGDT